MSAPKKDAKTQGGKARLAGEWQWRKRVDLKPSPENSKIHDKDQIEQIAKSYDEYGWTMPILIDEKSMILAGHGRWMMAEQRGIDEVPVIVAKGWSQAQKRAYIIADNRLTEIGRWDKDKLAKELAELKALGTVPITGFNEKQIASIIMAEEARRNPSTAPKLSGMTYSVIITCEDEDDQAATLEKLTELGFKCRPIIN